MNSLFSVKTMIRALRRQLAMYMHCLTPFDSPTTLVYKSVQYNFVGKKLFMPKERIQLKNAIIGHFENFRSMSSCLVKFVGTYHTEVNLH